ncbi:hypothetical protein [Haloferula sp. A504]|uniref:hypothetical protein n=1 Tax=Haloferula sp. A504 TaxID=3373601 RepID=UPI0031C34556|nr:hypothetical protein [Verrucomicrobiaceae bacterium E54]
MAADAYAAGQSDRDRRYREAWDSPEAKAWLDGLDPAERARLEADGLLAPMLAHDGSSNGTGYKDDVAGSPAASEEAPAAPSNESLDDILADYPHIMESIEERARAMAGGAHGAELLRKLAILFIDQEKRGLHADCLSFVSGLALRMGESGTSLAKRHGITRQAFHKRCNELLDELGLPPSRAMKSKKSRTKFRTSNRRWAV